MCSGLAPKSGWRGLIETTLVASCFLHNYPPLHMPCLLRVAALHWSRGCHDEAESWDVGSRGASGPGRHLAQGGIWVGQLGSCSWRALTQAAHREMTWSLMEARLPQQMTQHVPRAHEGLTCPIETFFNREGQQRQWELISCEGQRGLRQEATFKQGGRSYCWCWHRWYIAGSVDLCQQPACRLPPFPNMHRLLLSPCGKGCWAGRREGTHLEGTQAGLAWQSGPLLQKLGTPPCPPIWLKRPVRIEEVCASYVALSLAPQISSQGNSWWHTLRKDLTCDSSNPAPLWVPHRLYSHASPQEHPIKTIIDNWCT